MSTKVVNLSDFAKELGAFTEGEIENLKHATVEGIAMSMKTLVENSPVDTGLYAASWDFTPTEQGAILGNYAPHAPIIEYGARPFTPPLRPLLQWAKRVLKDPSQPPEYSPEVWGLAKYTQAKIAREGMKPRAVMEKTIPKILENIRRVYERLER